MNTDYLLDVENLKLHFHTGGGPFSSHKGYIRAVDGISFKIKKGETLGLVGESGCGKSTTARAVAQLHRPTAGSVIFKGEDLTKLHASALLKARKNMQMVFQDPYASLNPRMTSGDIIAEPLKIYKSRGLINMQKGEIIDRVEDLMEKVGLSRFFRNRYPHEFSGGQRQRIGIARALALNPELILADEPVSALDVSIQAQILNLFKDLQQELGLTYLFIAHDLAVVRYISNRIAVMYLGVIVEIADRNTLFEKPLHPYTQALLSAAPIPDPVVERKRQRIILTGDVPSPDKERHGCYFYDRCPKRMDKCQHTIPKLKDADSDHQVACFLYHDPE
ncbi:ABC transporter ATP-binding protein [Gracilinema caldarium]|uniref:Oligopeptide/dipeptide ABC transporter, ATPase subunit n=1 Tax=Gracilinema caldarium (strain ATCC 51460 / DSM 7334 / H1) TaxID=744872 RepID=F8F4J1_GRAC1|nr:oligopeptide/dipeptide ABC transporter ATP-binding protein [Gracilinema caldarium]AEJ20638.1 oligopeptide/dipeptide ABC transporter, ATPase subunit [Gracilinema caldarium DSM 7334]